MKVLFTIFFILFTQITKGDYWTQKANFPDGTRDAPFSFSIGNKGYTGCGSNTHAHFWEYDPAINIWTQKADFLGIPRQWAIGFSILNKGYAGLGYSGSVPFLEDFWEYDPAINTWSQKANFGGGKRAAAMTFSLGNKGYVFGGGAYDSLFHTLNDFWEYDPILDNWTQLTNLPAISRESGAAFGLAGKGYVGIGIDTSGFVSDFWEYDLVSASWTQKANFPGGVRTDPAYFTIGNYGYVGIGELPVSPFVANDFWQYDPSQNQWIQKLNFAGIRRDEASFFSIGNKGYIGLGTRDAPPSNQYIDFWEYTPDSTTSVQELNKNNLQINIFPNPVNDKLNVQVNFAEPAEIILYDIASKKIMQKKFTNSTSLNFEQFNKGIYLYEIWVRDGLYKQGKIVKD